MDIIEISYIDTAELDGYISESIKRWEKIEENKWFAFQIETGGLLRDEFSTKAVYYCSTDYCVNHSGPSLVISVEYNEVEMTGKIEIEYQGSFSNAAKQKLIDIFNDVIGTFDPSTKT
ncbi:hypothetical protein E4H12_01000 [Candidatus Thorarchaeota archaeon]|nr:MAG: hypothetical protein E4H12_01000 [Candidatus Thorarchaeota archaeon]